MKAIRFSSAAVRKNKAAAAIVNTHTKPTDNKPAGKALEAVRGFFASNVLSAIRLHAIAAERAPTIATTIQRICQAVGRPLAASTAPRNANGNANSVCSILIISRVSRVFLIRVDTASSDIAKKAHKSQTTIEYVSTDYSDQKTICVTCGYALCRFLWHAGADGSKRISQATLRLQKRRARDQRSPGPH